MNEIVYGKHRSLALAERHLAQLNRMGGPPWRITKRGNASGQFSSRGHYFTFEQEAEEEEEEYEGAFDSP